MTIADPIKAQRQPPSVMVVGASSFTPGGLAAAVKAARLARRIQAVTETELSAKAIITNQLGEILILKDAKSAWHDLPGGHLHDGEETITGLVREVREETGISIGDIKPKLTTMLKLGRRKRPVQLFTASAMTTDVNLSHEHSDFQWVKPGSLCSLNLGVFLEPVLQILSPAFVQAAQPINLSLAEANPPSDHHETARRAAERVWRAAVDDWLSDLNAKILAAIFGSRDKDYNGVWVPVFDAAVLSWAATVDQAAQKAYRLTAQTLGHDAGVANEPSPSALKAFARARGKALERFPVAVREKLAASVQRGLEGHEDGRAIGRRIGEALEQVHEGAGRRVAATEAQVVYGKSQSEALELAGFRTKRWVTMGDDRVRDSHYLCESQGFIPVGESFQNGLRFPGDENGDISEVANCRCNLEGGL